VFVARIAKSRPGQAGEFEERAGLAPLKIDDIVRPIARVGASMSIIWPPIIPSLRPRAQVGDQLGPHFRRRMCRRVGQDLEGQRQ